jgi:hypothetical protein
MAESESIKPTIDLGKIEPIGTESAPGQPDEPTTQATATARNYSLSPRRVGMFAVAFATASLTALAVVASVEGAEALTTIALVLAIVAFTIQIFLFVVQSQAASEQRVRSEQLNTQTRALLAEVRATAQATQAMVSQQFNQLLQAFVTGAAQTAEETKFDPVSFERRLMSNIRAAAQPPATSVAQASGTDGPERTAVRPTPSRLQRERAAARLRTRNERPDRLKAFPSEDEGRASAILLRELEPNLRIRLKRLAEDELFAAERGSYVGIGPSQEDDALRERNLVTSARVDTGDGRQVVTRLTDDGVSAARLLTALGEIPTWARDVIDADESEAPFSSDGDDDIPF